MQGPTRKRPTERGSIRKTVGETETNQKDGGRGENQSETVTERGEKPFDVEDQS